MDMKRKLVATAVGALALAGLGGAGTAIAQSTSDTSTPASVQEENTGDFTPANEVGQPEPAQSADEKADAPGAEQAEAPEKDGTVHEDPDGVDVDYTPAGEAAEAPAQG